MPEDGAWASPMACPQCGRWYYSQCRNQTRLTILSNAAHTAPDETFASDLVQQLSDLMVNAPNQPERRKEIRRQVDLKVIIAPLSKSAAPLAECREVTITNLSSIGAELQSREDITTEFVLIDLTRLGMGAVQLIARVCWRVIDSGHYRVGCEFLNNLGAPLPLAE